jgi:putative peptidoglycan lipid II flippase
MLPYLLFICIASQLSTMLYVARHFTVPALVPTLLNVVWLVAACLIAPWFAPNRPAQAYVLAAGVIVAGILQVLAQLPTLRRLGFHFDYHWPAAREGTVQVVRNMAPMVAGLSVTQINTFVAMLIAWGLTAATGGPQLISWLGGVRYPMQQGAVAAMSYGSQLYEFPLGIVGSAVAIAIFPLLSRHAVRGDFRQLSADMTLGLRLVICLSVPAGMGLIVLAEPIARLLFEHGQFLPEDTIRTARLIAVYATGVWAYCASAVLVRGFYALNDRATPVRIGMWSVGINLVLNVTLIWTLAEAGLAVSTSVAAAAQAIALVAIFSRRRARLDWRQLALTTGRTLAATALMASAVLVSLPHTPSDARLASQLIRVGVPLSLGIAAYCGLYWLLGGRELSMLMGRRGEEEPEDVER